MDKLKIKWSPEQISGYAKANNIFSISHERIYQFIRDDKASGGNLFNSLRQGKNKYRKGYGSKKKSKIALGKVSIDLRPDLINNKERLGDWEIDTIVGKDLRSAIITVTERVSKKLVAKYIPSHTAIITARATVTALSPYAKYVHSITSDNGTEFADHKIIAKDLNSDYYFAHPYSSWERGLNENTNGLLRQYLPKRSDFRLVSENELDFIVEEINNRPRKTLGYKTPNQVFEEEVKLCA